MAEFYSYIYSTKQAICCAWFTYISKKQNPFCTRFLSTLNSGNNYILKPRAKLVIFDWYKIAQIIKIILLWDHFSLPFCLDFMFYAHWFWLDPSVIYFKNTEKWVWWSGMGYGDVVEFDQIMIEKGCIFLLYSERIGNGWDQFLLLPGYFHLYQQKRKWISCTITYISG